MQRIEKLLKTHEVKPHGGEVSYRQMMREKINELVDFCNLMWELHDSKEHTFKKPEPRKEPESPYELMDKLPKKEPIDCSNITHRSWEECPYCKKDDLAERLENEYKNPKIRNGKLGGFSGLADEARKWAVEVVKKFMAETNHPGECWDWDELIEKFRGE